ncbi:MAG: hypothetical protein E7532_00010 [Ruminococcaceae bacterium]|nr:hypothetical protein [Oscillospiraceae bacterium]
MKSNTFKRVLSLVLCLACLVSVAVVAIPSASATELSEIEPLNNSFAVVSPVPTGSTIEPIEQPARLDTLEGKTIALVGGSFSASVTHAILRDMLEEEFGCKTYYMDEIGKGGTFNPNNQSAQSKEFQQKLISMGVDAVISGNCGCGICTVKETGNALAAEYIGIPAVVVGAETFIAQIRSTGLNRGVPVVRTAAYPGAFAADTTEEQERKARDILYSQVVTALTTEITQAEIDEIAGAVGSVKYNDVIFTGSYQRIQEFYEVNEMTDGLPVVPPTKAKVEYYLAYTDYEAEDLVCTNRNGEAQDVPPANRSITAYQVAVNAVMAGCPPEYMPLCIAITKCLGHGDFYKPLQSTHAWTPYILVNGPIAEELGISFDENMTNAEANKLLGRYMSLAMLNLAGYKIKENRMGTFGYMEPFAFAEDEKTCEAIGWEPYHVMQGFESTDNVITCGSTITWGNSVTPATDNAEKIMQLMAWDITEKQQNGLGNTNPRVPRMVFITAEAAKDLADGYTSKDVLEDTLISTARRPLWMRTYAHYWANTGSKIHLNQTFDEHYAFIANGGSTENVEADIVDNTAVPQWLQGVVPFDSLVTAQTMEKGHTGFVVTGGDSKSEFQVMPGGDCASYEIELPKNWEGLLAGTITPEVQPDAETGDGYYNPNYNPGGNTGGNTGGDTDDDTDDDTPVATFSATVPSGVTDGTYRIVSSTNQVSSEGRMYFDSSSDTLTYYSVGGSASAASVLGSATYADFITLVEAAGLNSTMTVAGGKVTDVILRVPASSRNMEKDATTLGADVFENISLTIAANTDGKGSSTEGSAALDGAVIKLNGDVRSFDINLEGTLVMGASSTADFITLSGSKATVNETPAAGDVAYIGIDNGDGTYKALTVVYNSDNTYTITYNTALSM